MAGERDKPVDQLTLRVTQEDLDRLDRVLKQSRIPTTKHAAALAAFRRGLDAWDAEDAADALPAPPVRKRDR